MRVTDNFALGGMMVCVWRLVVVAIVSVVVRFGAISASVTGWGCSGARSDRIGTRSGASGSICKTCCCCFFTRVPVVCGGEFGRRGTVRGGR
jgi:hypothetical protein